LLQIPELCEIDKQRHVEALVVSRPGSTTPGNSF
jgi:hypothetical protein